MKRIAIAGRVSTEHQKEQKTIDSQIEELERKAKEDSDEVVIVDRYFDDGWSGDILARPELDRLRDDAKLDKWDEVWFLDRDRLSRKYAYQEIIIEELTELRKKIIFINQPQAQSVEDRVLQGIHGVFAEYEKAKITERFRRGKLHRARSGHVLTQSPFGFDYIKRSGNEYGKFIINEEEAEIIKMIFNWVDQESLSVRHIIRSLLEKGINPPKQNRSVWNSSVISRLLRNTTYKGVAYYNKSQSCVPKTPKNNERYKQIKKSSRTWKEKEDWIAIEVPAIITPEQFDRVQEKLRHNNIFNNRNHKNEYLLTSLIYCSCGCKRMGEGHVPNLYYRCINRIIMHPLPKTCHESGVNAQVIDTRVWSKLTKFFKDSELVKKQFETFLKNKEQGNQMTEDTLKLEKQLTALSEEEQRYITAYGSGVITVEQLKSQTDTIQRRIKEIQSRIDQTQNPNIKFVYLIFEI